MCFLRKERELPTHRVRVCCECMRKIRNLHTIFQTTTPFDASGIAKASLTSPVIKKLRLKRARVENAITVNKGGEGCVTLCVTIIAITCNKTINFNQY